MKYLILWRQGCQACANICDMGVWNHNYSLLVGSHDVDLIVTYLIKSGDVGTVVLTCNTPEEAQRWDKMYSAVKIN